MQQVQEPQVQCCVRRMSCSAAGTVSPEPCFGGLKPSGNLAGDWARGVLARSAWD